MRVLNAVLGGMLADAHAEIEADADRGSGGGGGGGGGQGRTRARSTSGTNQTLAQWLAGGLRRSRKERHGYVAHHLKMFNYMSRQLFRVESKADAALKMACAELKR